MTRRRAHPSVFLFLILPFGALGGYLSVAVAYLFSHAGVTVEQVATMVALGLAPHTWKFAWAPIADTTLTRKGWYAIGGALTAVGIAATGVLPTKASSLPALAAIVLISNIACTFLGMSVESLMAYDAPEKEKGRAGGWFQAGSLGGAGVGGGAGLWLAQHLPSPWMAGTIVGGVCLLCALALPFVDEPAASHRRESLGASLAFVAKDLWQVVRSRPGFLAMALCFVPVGSGAAAGLFAAIAGDWHASADTVALVSGVVGGIVAAAGCLAGGWVCDRMDRKAAYVLFGALQIGCAALMAGSARTEAMYVVYTTLYGFIAGLTYAGFTAFVLEAMGLGAAATKYNVFASLSNMPIWYMTLVLGRAHGRWGSGGMLLTEAACASLGIALFYGVVALAPRRLARPA